MKLNKFDSLKINSISNRSQLSNSCFYLLKVVIFFYMFDLINNTKLPEKKFSYITPNNLPDELEKHMLSLTNVKSKECLIEITLIHKKDFKDPFVIPYKNNKTLSTNLKEIDNFFNKTNKQLIKKTNKYSFLENKNFTGIRWVNPKTMQGEMKKLLQNYIQQLAEFFEKNYFNCKNTLPEFVFENFQFFFSKINEIKKIFKNYYLFKGIKKFCKCLSKTNAGYNTNKFGENIVNGKITIKALLNNLKIILSGTQELLDSHNIESFSKALKKIILNVKGLPILN